MADEEIATLTDGVAQVTKPSGSRNRPASPIIDIYGDEEDSYDHGGTINVDLQSPPSSPSNDRHDSFFGDSLPSGEQPSSSGVWNWFAYARSQIDAGLTTANNYLEENQAIQATTSTIYSVGEEAHKKIAQAGGYTGTFGSTVVSQIQNYGQVLLSTVDLAKQKDMTPVELNIICDKHTDVTCVTAAFQDHFYKTTSVTYDVVSGLAAQIVGPAPAIEGCKLRIQAARAQKLVSDDAVVVAVDSFINEIVPGTWVEQYCLMVSDIKHDIDLHVFSQPVNVPSSLTSKSREATPTEYALRSSGYAKSIIEVISETFPDVNIKDWYTHFVGVSNRQVISLVSQHLAALYHQRFANTQRAAVKSDDEELDVDAMERS